jgi:outer membrane protein assembly factor BamB
MKQTLFFLLLVFVFTPNLLGQFNNCYLTNYPGQGQGTLAGIEEDAITGDYVMPMIYGDPLIGDNNFGFLRLGQNGDSLSCMNYFSDPSLDVYSDVNYDFIKSSDGGFFFAGGLNGPLLIKLNSNSEVLWVAETTDPIDHYFMGGKELFNGDLILAYDIPNTPYNIQPMRRYSSSGVLLGEFNMELDLEFSRPHSYVVMDSLIFVSFHRWLIGNEYDVRRNCIVCYNAFTGDEIWEVNHIAPDIYDGYVDPMIDLTNADELFYVYGHIEETISQGVLSNGIYVRTRVAKLSLETGEFISDLALGELNTEYVIYDAIASEDGGIVVLAKSVTEGDLDYIPIIMKLDDNLDIEWSYHYFPPEGYYELGVNAYLYDAEITSDDCVIASGESSGWLETEQIYFQVPWVLKVDACGQEIESDCTLSGLDEIAGESKINIYPNPAEDRIYIKGEDAIDRAEIFDLQGRKVLVEYFSGAHEQTLYIDHFPAGLYFVNIYTQSGKHRLKRIAVN